MSENDEAKTNAELLKLRAEVSRLMQMLQAGRTAPEIKSHIFGCRRKISEDFPSHGCERRVRAAVNVNFNWRLI